MSSKIIGSPNPRERASTKRFSQAKNTASGPITMQIRYDGLNAFFGVTFEDDLGLAFKRGKLDGTEDRKIQIEWGGVVKVRPAACYFYSYIYS